MLRGVELLVGKYRAKARLLSQTPNTLSNVRIVRPWGQSSMVAREKAQIVV